MMVPRDPYDVHPKNKQDFGNRLALQALKKVYGNTIMADGPFFGTVELRRDTLVAQTREPNQQLVLKIKDGTTGFEIADPLSLPRSGCRTMLFVSIPAPSIGQKCNDMLHPTTAVFKTKGLPMAAFRRSLYWIKTA